MVLAINAKKITSQRLRYCYNVEKLPTEVAVEVIDLLETIPVHMTFLHQVNIKRMGKSKESMLRVLFNNVELGDRTPSQLLCHMRSLLGDNIMADSILKRMWQDKLPTMTTQILAPMSEDENLERFSLCR